MKLETAHKILIGTAIGFSLIYALFETVRWSNGGGVSALARAGGGLAAALMFAAYLRSFLGHQGN